jgi:hypothetical protein
MSLKSLPLWLRNSPSPPTFTLGVACCLFGWRLAPLFAVRMFLRAIELSKKSRYDLNSAFAWDHVPSSKDYDPVLLCVAKVRFDKKLACDEVTCVDDGRVLGPDQPLTQKAVRQLGSAIQYQHGAQEAGRKRRPVGQRTGAWAGQHVVYTDCGLDRKFTSKNKWDKAREAVQWMRQHVSTGQDLPYKAFNSKIAYQR